LGWSAGRVRATGGTPPPSQPHGCAPQEPHNRRAYEREIREFFEWCAITEVDPRDCRRGDIDAYAAVASGHLNAASLARRLSTISSWYQYAQSNDLVDKNPALAVDLPTLSPDTSATMGLTPAQLQAFMPTARESFTARDAALLAMLAELGMRCAEVIGLNLTDFSHDRGHRVVTVRGKGNKNRKLPAPVLLGRTLGTYLE
jgi:site-specific recombinase XerD